MPASDIEEELAEVAARQEEEKRRAESGEIAQLERMAALEGEVHRAEKYPKGSPETFQAVQVFDMEDGMDLVEADLDRDVEFDRSVAIREARDEEEIDRIRGKLGLVSGELSDPETETLEIEPADEQQLAKEVESIFETEPERKGELRSASKVFAGRVIESLSKALSEGRLAAPEIAILKKLLGDIESGTFEGSRALDEIKSHVKMDQLKFLGSTGLDFIPVFGPGKMLVETYKGETLDGQKLKGWRRGMHGLEGAAFLILDATGIGAIGSKAIKGSTLAAKIFTRSAAMGRRLGIAREIYAPIFRTGKAIERNPILAKIASHAFGKIIESRRAKGLI